MDSLENSTHLTLSQLIALNTGSGLKTSRVENMGAALQHFSSCPICQARLNKLDQAFADRPLDTRSSYILTRAMASDTISKRHSLISRGLAKASLAVVSTAMIAGLMISQFDLMNSNSADLEIHSRIHQEVKTANKELVLISDRKNPSLTVRLARKSRVKIEEHKVAHKIMSKVHYLEGNVRFEIRRNQKAGQLEVTLAKNTILAQWNAKSKPLIKKSGFFHSEVRPDPDISFKVEPLVNKNGTIVQQISVLHGVVNLIRPGLKALVLAAGSSWQPGSDSPLSSPPFKVKPGEKNDALFKPMFQRSEQLEDKIDEIENRFDEMRDHNLDGNFDN